MDPANRNREITPAVGSFKTKSTSPAWKLDLLMQKLRQKSKGTTLLDTAKNVKASLSERRCIIDSTENQSCLDQLQQSIKVNNLQTMVEKLEMVTRQQGLKFTPGTTGNEWFISSDMFYLELVIDTTGVVQEVKIQHEGKAEQQSCPEIVQSLQQNNFTDLAEHLEGLVSIYQLNADKKTKSKVFIALQALESDLSAMASTYSNLTDGELIVMKSLLGILQCRKGGHPCKIVFHVSPYEFLDMETKKMMSPDVGTILEKQLGMVATVSVQAYSSQKLQMSATVSITRTPDGKSIPRYGVLNPTNSTWLQACFIVKLQSPIPICRELLQAIQTTTGINCFDALELTPILSLITKHVSGGALDCGENKGLNVTLPDQSHCYFMTETENLEGLMFSNIPFTLASQLPQVIFYLRQQLSFNTLVGSCVRVDSKEDSDSIVFEVNALSYQNLTVSFQHPLEDTLVTLEFDLRDVTHPQCHLHAVATVSDIIPTLEETACKVVHRTMSIPITLRAVIRRWQSMKIKVDQPNPNFNLRVGSSFDSKFNLTQPSDLSCAAESERVQNQQQQQSNQQVPGMVMNWSNAGAGCITPNSSFTISPVNSIQTTTFPNQTPMELVSPYITLSNFQNLNHLNFNPSMVNMFASQITNQQAQQVGNQSSSVLMNLLDQAGQQSRKRKRKIGSNESHSGHASTSMPMPRPSPSPSPKSPRLPSAKRSPKRRPSEGSEESSPRVSTPNTPLSNASIGHMLPDLGLDGDPRWNIDITPVGPGMDTTFSKMLSSLSSEFQGLDDSDIEIESEIPGKFPLKLMKKSRDLPKRSISLDSSARDHQSTGSTTIQSLFDHSGEGFKPMVTPSLSITPVSGTTSATVNSILASMRPGIEIIPLPNPVNIPNSITVTPILPKPSPMKKNSIDEPDGKNSTSKKSGENRKRKMDGSGSPSTKGVTFGNVQMRPIPRPGGMGGLKRSNSVNPRPVLPKGSSNFGMSPAALALAKGITGGKPSVSTLKSVSASPSSSTNVTHQHQGSQKPKLNREKMKSSVGPASKMQKLQHAFLEGMKVEMSHHGLPIPKLEPIGSLCGTSSIKTEQGNVKLDHMGHKNMPGLKTGMVGPPVVKKAGLLAVIDKLKSAQHSVDEGIKKEVGKVDIPKGTPMDMTKAKALQMGPGGSGVQISGNQLPGSEYMIKPGAGGQGLKFTINKTKGLQPKDKLKGAVLKGPSGVPGLKKGLTPSRIPSPKLIPSPSSTNAGNKKVKPEGIMSGQIKSPSMKGSPTGGLMPKTKSEGELDLSKKFFMPGGVGIFDGPKFDTKFQIPKKSRSITNPIVTEKVEDLSIPTKEASSEGFSSESPSSQTPPPLISQTESEMTVEREPPTLTLAADVETCEKNDEQPPVLSAEVHLEPPPLIPMTGTTINPILAAQNVDDFISPQSPDPTSIVSEEYKSTPTIPTTPLAVTLPTEPSPSPSPAQPPPEPMSTPTPPIDDEDGLVMDIPSEQLTPQSQPSNAEKSEQMVSSAPATEEPEVENTGMPPPPPRLMGEEEAMSPSVQLVPSSSLSSVVPVMSVHIVHSPQPNSPAFLMRSPLVVQSPHSSHASPYAIDDELMDEALIG